MHYKACLFDFDYTLGDATEGIVQSTNFALQKIGLPAASRDRIRQTVGMSLPDTFTFLTKNHTPKLRSLFVSFFMEKADVIMTQNTELYTDTIEIIARLHAKGINLGIVSTKRRHRLFQILDKFEIGHFFDVVVGGDEVENPKPDPEALLRAIKLLGTMKQEVVYVGDSIVDVKTAKFANVDFVAVTTGTTKNDLFLQYPHIAIIDSLSDLLNIIKTKGFTQ